MPPYATAELDMEQPGTESSNVAAPTKVNEQAEKDKRAREAKLEASKKRDLDKDPATPKKEQVPDPVVLKGNKSNSSDLVFTNPSCLPFSF